jgi:type VI secretion system protein ImpH
VSERLLAESRRYSFFQLVRLVLAGRPDAVAPGGAGPAAREPLRFRPNASLDFAVSDVEELERLETPGGERYRVTVNFMGLYGPASPLPNHFTEELLWGGTDAAGARDFLDLFHHRVISFLYRSWEKYRYPVQFDPDTLDDFSRRALCLIGLGTRGMEAAVGLSVLPLLRTSGSLASRHRSAAGLEGLLRDHFAGVGVRVDPCLERLVPIPRDQLFRLGRRGSRLGEDTCLGEAVRDRSGAFRITLGPLDGADQFRSFLPRGENLQRLVRLVRLYVADPLDFDVTLRLRAPAVPALQLAPDADLPLGQMSWIAPRGREEGRGRLTVHELDPLASRRAPGGRHETHAGAGAARLAAAGPGAPPRSTTGGLS